MSNEATRWVAENTTRCTATERLVLYRIADWYNESWDRSWPSLDRLIAETSLGRSTVLRTIANLQTKRLLLVERWVLNESARKIGNRYLLPGHRPSVEAIRGSVLVHTVSGDVPGLRVIKGTNMAVEWPLTQVPQRD